MFIWGSIWSTDGREDVAFIWPVYITFYTLPKGVYTGSQLHLYLIFYGKIWVGYDQNGQKRSISSTGKLGKILLASLGCISGITVLDTV